MKTLNSVLLIFILVTTRWCLLEAKVYERCELARALRDQYNFQQDQIPIWICIVEHESHYDTAAVNRKSGSKYGDHGIFQINDRDWCSTSKKPGKDCLALCSQFEDDDISNDVTCLKKIYADNERMSGDGYTSWEAYANYCRGSVASYIQGCF